MSSRSRTSDQQEGAQSGKKPRRGGDPVCFPVLPVMSAIKVLESEALKKQFHAPLGVTQSMPHIRVPLGLKREALLEVMLDSCAGLNLGGLSHHKSIFEARPEIVHQFAWIRDLSDVEELEIGGVSNGAPGLKAVALIAHKAPHRIMGAPVLVTLALAEGAASNTVVGLPFMRATRAALFMEKNGQDTAIIQKLGTTFKIDCHPPLIGDKAPQSDRGSQASHHFSAPTERQLQDEAEELRNKLAGPFITTGLSTSDGFQGPASPQPAPDPDPPQGTVPAHPSFVPAPVFEGHSQPAPKWRE